MWPVGSEERGQRRHYKKRVKGDEAVEPRRRSFNALVREAVAGLPDELRERLDNVDIIVRARPSPAELRSGRVGHGHTLLGLYVGVPLIHRTSGYNLMLPDRIYLYRQALEAVAPTDEALVRQIRRTVLHEIAHHFGISDARLHEIGAY